MTRALALLLTISATLAASALAASSAAFPNRIELPDGFRPEGIATAGQRFFTGSLANGAIYSGSLRTGQGALLVQPQAGRVAVGMKADRGRLFVAGGNTGDGVRVQTPRPDRTSPRTSSRPAAASSTTSS